MAWADRRTLGGAIKPSERTASNHLRIVVAGYPRRTALWHLAVTCGIIGSFGGWGWKLHASAPTERVSWISGSLPEPGQFPPHPFRLGRGGGAMHVHDAFADIHVARPSFRGRMAAECRS